MTDSIAVEGHDAVNTVLDPCLLPNKDPPD